MTLPILAELDIVRLLKQIPDSGLRVGDLGTIVHVHSPDAFEIELYRVQAELL